MVLLLLSTNTCARIKIECYRQDWLPFKLTKKMKNTLNILLATTSLWERETVIFECTGRGHFIHRALRDH